MIRTEHRDAVTVVTLDRPERRNAVDREALHGLETVIDELPGGTRALVLTGSGGHFCAGADLRGVEDPEFVATLTGVLRGLREVPLPTMAAVDGFALGAGTQLAMACDLRSATAAARFGVPAAKLGLMVDQWTIRRLVALVGQAAARDLLLSADPITGERAHALGFVQRLGGVDEALQWAERIAALAPLTLAGMKVGLNEADAAADVTPAFADAFSRAWASADLAEGLRAFGEKRPPSFQGR